MIDRKTLEAILKEVLRGTGIFQVDIRVDPGNRILVHVDKTEGITIEDCARISRALEGKLNRDREDFSLEVSSPGLDAPLRVPEQYMKNIGRMVSVQLRDGSRVLGILRDSDGEGIHLEVPAGKKGAKPESQDLKFTEITSTKVQIQF
jgi:ribosome maturation factor RimP